MHQVTDRTRSPILRVDRKPEILPTHETFLGAAYTHEETGQGFGPSPVPICLLPRREDPQVFDHARVRLSAERNCRSETQREARSPSTAPHHSIKRLNGRQPATLTPGKSRISKYG